MRSNPGGTAPNPPHVGALNHIICRRGPAEFDNLSAWTITARFRPHDDLIAVYPAIVKHVTRRRPATLRPRRFAIGAICALLVAEVMGAAPNLAAAPPTLHVDEAWIRWLPAGLPAAGYATLTNTGDTPVSLVAATSPYFGDLSIHRSVNRGGSMTMSPVSEITISPHSKLEFESQGYHFMLMQPTAPLESRRNVPITLRFADGSLLTVLFEVRKPSESRP
jgi:copper(I)-binding protein